MKKFISAMICTAITAALIAIPAGAAPSGLSAQSSVLIEAETGTVLFESNADERRAMASTTKIMTAILTIEAGDLDSEFIVDDYAIMVEGTTMGLQKGDRVSRRDLLYGILLPSGNDAANAAAVSVSGSIGGFVSLMNEKAGELGLKDTHFATPSGLDAKGHYTTARDLAMLSAYAMKNETFREIVCCKQATVSFGNPPYQRTLYNSNKMLKRYDGAVGIKTGFTDNARRCLVSAAERDGVTLIAVTLNAPDDWNDHTRMLDYGFTQVSAYPLDTKCGTRVNAAGTGQSTGVYANAATAALTRNQVSALSKEIILPRMVYGGVKKGQQLGEIRFMLDGKLLKTVPLYADTDIAEENGELNWFQKILSFFGVYI